MAFVPKTFTTILQRLADRVVARSELTDTVQGGALWHVLSAVAREVDDLYFQMTALQDAWDIDTASGTELDLRAADIPDGQIVRLDAAKATVTVVFSRSGSTGLVTIPAGSVVSVPDGPSFATSSAGSIPDGDTSSASIPALATVAGADGNVAINTITQLEGVAGVETVTNPTVGVGGSDRESDPQLRERIRGYLRSLSRGTPDALKYAALSVDLSDEGFGRVVSAQVLEFVDNVRGKVNLYIDDGNGTAAVIDDNTGTPEAVVTNATGGEQRFYVAHVPIVSTASFDLEINATPVAATDYRVDFTTGLVILDETAYPTGLTVGDDVTVEYTWYEGLIAEVQKVINGDPNDRANYPGFRAAGVQVFVLAPATTQLAIEAVLTPDGGTDADTLRDAVASAFIRYVNGLGIGQDVIFTELVHQAQSVPGLRDIAFTTPTGNVTVGDGELIRLSSSNIDLT